MPTLTSESARLPAPEPTDVPGIKRQILARARDMGFEAVGVAAPDSVGPAGKRLGEFLDAGMHGDMDWMAAKRGRRNHPRRLWPGVRSILVLGTNYGPESDPLETPRQAAAGAISVYAQGRDYHDVIKKRLKVLGRWIAESFSAEVKVFVDTAPVLEKPLAAAAGLGWQGKHTNLVSRRHGSWLFLAEIFTSLDLGVDTLGADHCGDCRACLDICPTAAFPAPYRLDARRCISYLTIEHKGHIPEEFRVPMGNRIYGCDDCLAACPWNKFAARAAETAFHGREDLRSPLLADLAALDDTRFRALFKGSAVKRLGRDRFVRNVLIAVGNSGEADLVASARALLADKSPLVRAMAAWACKRLLDRGSFAALAARRLAQEGDTAVRAEWRAP